MRSAWRLELMLLRREFAECTVSALFTFPCRAPRSPAKLAVYGALAWSAWPCCSRLSSPCSGLAMGLGASDGAVRGARTCTRARRAHRAHRGAGGVGGDRRSRPRRDRSDRRPCRSSPVCSPWPRVGRWISIVALVLRAIAPELQACTAPWIAPPCPVSSGCARDGCRPSSIGDSCDHHWAGLRRSTGHPPRPGRSPRPSAPAGTPGTRRERVPPKATASPVSTSRSVTNAERSRAPSAGRRATSSSMALSE